MKGNVSKAKAQMSAALDAKVDVKTYTAEMGALTDKIAALTNYEEINLLNSAAYHSNKFFDAGNYLWPSTWWDSYAYIPVNAQTKYLIRITSPGGFFQRIVAFRDANNNLLSFNNSTVYTDAEVIETPENATYMALSFAKQNTSGAIEYSDECLVEHPDVVYFSANGDDKNDGRSSYAPKKTLQKYLMCGNTTLLLKSGDVFEEALRITGSNVKISTYGGTLPAVIDGRVSLNGSTWRQVNDNIYSIELNVDDIGTLVIDGEVNWRRIQEFNFVNELEYYFDIDSRTLYFCCLEAPESLDIAFTRGKNGITITAEAIHISNVAVQYFGCCGIEVMSSSNVYIERCNVGYIGGSLLDGAKYGNGIQVWMNGVYDVHTTKCYVHDCIDAGITAQISTGAAETDSDTIYFEKNKVERCIYGIEVFSGDATYAHTNIRFVKNKMINITDITEGYRWDDVATNWMSFVISWAMAGTKNSVEISDNTCLSSDLLALAFNSTSTAGIIFDNNVFATTSTECVRCAGSVLAADASGVSGYYSKATDKFIINPEMQKSTLLNELIGLIDDVQVTSN